MSQTTIYVNPLSGSDAADGKSKATALASVARVNALEAEGVLPPDLAIYLLGNAQHAGPLRLDRKDPRGIFMLAGYDGRPTLTSQGETAVVIQSEGAVAIDGLILCGSGSGELHDGLDMRAGPGRLLSSTGPGWTLRNLEASGFTFAGINLLYGRQVAVEDVEVHDNGLGLVAVMLTDAVLRGINAHDNGLATGPESWPGVTWSAGLLLEGCTQTLLEDFQVHDNGHRCAIGCGVWVSNAQGENHVRYGQSSGNQSRLPDSSGDGQGVLVSGNSVGVTVERNETRGNNVGLTVMSDLEGGLSRQHVVRGNFGVGDTVGIQILGTPTTRLEDVLFQSNYVLDPAYKALDASGGWLRGMRFEENYFWLDRAQRFWESSGSLEGLRFAENRWQPGPNGAFWLIENVLYFNEAEFLAAVAAGAQPVQAVRAPLLSRLAGVNPLKHLA